MKGIHMKFIDTREIITLKDFEEKFCNKCYWHINNRCHIRIVTLDFCCHSQVEKWKYKMNLEMPL